MTLDSTAMGDLLITRISGTMVSTERWVVSEPSGDTRCSIGTIEYIGDGRFGFLPELGTMFSADTMYSIARFCDSKRR